MGVDFKSALKNGVTRVLLLILLGYVLLLITYAVSFYHLKINSFQKSENAKLTAISNTLASVIDGDELDKIITEHTTLDGISTNEQVAIYKKYSDRMREIKNFNHLKSDIYTISFDKKNRHYFFGISSATKPYYHHQYKTHPKEYHDLYMEGGHFGPYMDKHGHWLSSLAPIKNTKGEVVSIVQVDLPFDNFMKEARKTVLTQVAYLSLFILLLAGIIIRTIIKFLKEEEKHKQEIEEQHHLVKEKNKLITSSINYAQRIQEGILPTKKDISKEFPESFVLYTPKDSISGDFYYFSKQEGNIYIAAADCTGHGVPGAMMSMISISLLNEQIKSNQRINPGKILTEVDNGIKKAFQIDRKTKDGMDIALCCINKERMILKYAGAYRPLIIIRNNELLETKGTRFSIGDSRIDHHFEGFDTHEIQLQKEDCIYLFSDGYVDQFGGPEGKKFMSKKLKTTLLNIHQLPMQEQYAFLHNEFQNWKGNLKQIDDVVVLGFKITD